MEADRVCKRAEDKFRLESIELERRLPPEPVILTETKRMLMDPRNMELRFSKKISQPTLACHEIKGEGNTCLEVGLYDSSTGERVQVGPVAFADVELVVLARGTDDCTGEEFEEKIVRVEGNKLPLLTVNVCTLQGGMVVLENVKFRHHAAKVNPKGFRLGARIVGTFDEVIVKEAKTESFSVKCYRTKYFMKKEIPNLTDEIWVLRNIQRRGKIEERLQAEGIDSIEKFLIHLLINPQELKRVARLTGKKWEGTVNHARKCQSYRMYWYFDSQENSGIVFDIFGELQWMYSEGEYAATSMLSEYKKVDADKLLSSALEHWGEVIPFDDPDSLQQYLTAVTTYFDLPSSGIPGQYPGINPGFSEMVYGSNNIQVPADPYLNQGIPISGMDWLPRCESFGIHDYGIIDGHHSQLAQCFGTMFTYFDGECDQGYVARIDGSGSVLAESKEVENEFLRIKKNLKRKKMSSEANPAGKKKKM